MPTRVSSFFICLVFSTFVASIFYVGKGTGLRPFAHFYDAIKASKSKEEEALTDGRSKSKKPSEKIQQIHDIWEKGVGVVSHHCFQVQMLLILRSSLQNSNYWFIYIIFNSSLLYTRLKYKAHSIIRMTLMSNFLSSRN